MPNGGPDNCSTCGFNRRNSGEWKHVSPDPDVNSYCTIRQVPITNGHWTYCRNWHTREARPDGPIYASGLYEDGHRRIPWHGSIEPAICANTRCAICGVVAIQGIEISLVEASPLAFCSNGHYLRWWKTQHPNDTA